MREKKKAFVKILLEIPPSHSKFVFFLLGGNVSADTPAPSAGSYVHTHIFCGKREKVIRYVFSFTLFESKPPAMWASK